METTQLAGKWFFWKLNLFALCFWQVEFLSATSSPAAVLVFVCVSCTNHISSSGVLRTYLNSTDELDVFAPSRPERSRWCVSHSVGLLWSHCLSGSAGLARRRSSHYASAAAGVVTAQRRLNQEAGGSWPLPVPGPAHHNHTHTVFIFCCCFFSICKSRMGFERQITLDII